MLAGVELDLQPATGVGRQLMQRILIATLMALFFGLFSMPAVQAAPANGWAVGSAVKAISPLDTIY